VVTRGSVKCTFSPPASEQSLKGIESALGVALPLDLCTLLLESNGIGDEYGDGIMSAEHVTVCNLQMREDTEQDDLYMPFDHLLFFGGAGNGDLFFYPIQGNGKINSPDIFVWNHENDNRQWVAKNLETFVEEWYGGRLHI
jgi:hypothetical protein